MIQPHYDEHGNVDGYLVRLPADPAHPKDSPAREVFVHSKYINGATQGGAWAPTPSWKPRGATTTPGAQTAPGIPLEA